MIKCEFCGFDIKDGHEEGINDAKLKVFE